MHRIGIVASAFALCLVSPGLAGAQASGGLSLPATELVNGVPVTGVAGRSSLVSFGFAVTEPSRLMFDLTGGTDPQIFLAKDRLPTLTDWDVRVGFGFPDLNLQITVEPGEYYLGVRDVNLDIPLPAEPFTLVGTVQAAGATPPLSFDLTPGPRRETSSGPDQLQYFTLTTPPTSTVVDFVTGERFGSGDATLFVGVNSFPRIDTNGAVVDYSVASGQPGNLERTRILVPVSVQLVAALHGAGIGYENVFLAAVKTDFPVTTLENNRGLKVSETASRHFVLSVPPGQRVLTLETAGGTGASHLAAKLEGPILPSAVFPDITPDWTASDDPRKPNDAVIVIPNPAPGDYFLRLDPEDAAGFTDVTVKARFRSQP